MFGDLLEFWKSYSQDLRLRGYNYTHLILLLLLYEGLLLFSMTSQVAVFSGVDFWFQFFYYLIPMRSLPISLMLIALAALYLFLDLRGIKDRAEKGEDKRKKKEDKSFEPENKKPFKLKAAVFALIPVEGFVYGSLLYVSLPFIAKTLASFLVPGIIIPKAVETHSLVIDYQTNWMQNAALSFGAGVYEELMFRMGLLIVLTSFLSKYLKTKKDSDKKGLIFLFQQNLRYILGHSLVKAKSGLWSIFNNWKLVPAVVVIAAFLFAVSHYILPHGDVFHIYSFVYRFIFGIFMNLLIFSRKFAVVAWAHAWYDLLYYSFA